MTDSTLTVLHCHDVVYYTSACCIKEKNYKTPTKQIDNKNIISKQLSRM